jgi:lanosterol synthase
MADDGMKMNGTNGVQLWDTAFSVKALLECRTVAEEPAFRPTLTRALAFLEETQVRRDVPDCSRVYRHISNGGFPFSTRDCGWIVADCTAEGLLAVLYLQELPYVHIPARCTHAHTRWTCINDAV